MAHFLLGAGVYLLVSEVISDVYRYLGGVVLCVLGGNAAYGALVGKRPWISKIGPLA
ncbi:MAG: hypothetical protein AB7F88_09270 [Pyrinomonadaceae bacterium]